MTEAAMADFSPARATIDSIAPAAPLSDEEIVRRVLSGETALFEVLMRRYNQRLYRAARAVVRDDSLAEDIMQAAYVRAFQHLHQFAARAPFGAWITRIAINEALARLRDARHYDAGRNSALGELQDEGDRMDRFASPAPNPEQAAASSELARLLEALIEALPDRNRSVFMLREVEGMTTAEVAAALNISEVSVKVRLHRARAALRRALTSHAAGETRQVFAFQAPRCDRVVANVLRQILTN